MPVRTTYREQVVLRMQQLPDGRIELVMKPETPGAARPRITVTQEEWARDGKKVYYKKS